MECAQWSVTSSIVRLGDATASLASCQSANSLGASAGYWTPLGLE